MRFPNGASIGPYRITAILGAGGMGEVYRARDTRLDRDVALKVLPDLFADDPDRLVRFEREAKVLAALNHPKIATIYGVEERALVMELVEGPTLAELIDRGAFGPSTLDEVLPIARQIAEALEAAHGAGVIHRDLKPANIKVRADGTVKVLDFGLAKVFDSSSESAASAANSPTFTTPGTQLGVILGTAAYMAPEQARGRMVDRRADLWAFGCVLFEMLTGRPAFTGEAATDILAAVVRGEPDWSSLPEATPQPIRRLLRRSLAKDPAERLADASTARLEIDDARREAAGAAPASPAPAMPHRGARLAWIVTAGMTLIAAASVVVGLRRPSVPADPHGEVRFQIDEAVSDGVVSPDGTAIVYVSRADGAFRWVLRTLSTGTSKPLSALGQDVWELFWSPDGRSLGFLAGQKLKTIDLATGAVQTLADAPTPRGGSWGPDGTILFAPGGNGPLYRIAATGGTAQAVTELREPQASHRHPIFLPDGRHFLFWVLGPVGVRGIYLGSLGDHRITRILDADGPAAFADPGCVLFFREGVLYVQRLDVAAAKVIGDAVPIASPFQINPTAGTRVSASRTGVVAFRTDPEVRRQIQWVDRSGKPLQTVGPPISNLIEARVSPDGRTIAVTQMQSVEPFIWLLDVARGTLSRFSQGNRPVWSPDGSRIAFQSGRDGFGRLYWQRVGANEPPELLFKSNEAQNIVDWSPDGHFIVFSSQSATSARDLWILPTDGRRTPTPFLQTPAEERNGAISPDGKWLTYESDEDGRIAVFVRPFPAPGRAWRVSTAEGSLPFWRDDGREIYYDASGQLLAVAFDASGASPSLGTPTPLFPLRSAVASQLRGRTDGRRFLAATSPEDTTTVAPLTVIVNWAGAGR